MILLPRSAEIVKVGAAVVRMVGAAVGAKDIEEAGGELGENAGDPVDWKQRAEKYQKLNRAKHGFIGAGGNGRKNSH